MIFVDNNRKKILFASLPLLFVVAAVGALVTYQFVTPQLTVYEKPANLTATSNFNQTYAIAGDTVELTGTITNPNAHWNFSIAAITIENIGTATIKVWYGNANNYIILGAGQSITIPVAQLPFTAIGAGAAESFTAYVIPQTAGTLQLSATLQGDWVLVP